MGIVDKFIKEGQLTKEEYPELLHLYQDPDAVRLLREEAVRIQKKYFITKKQILHNISIHAISVLTEWLLFIPFSVTQNDPIFI